MGNLLANLRSGSQVARNELCEASFETVKRICSLFGPLSDEMISQSMLFLVEYLEEVRLGLREIKNMDGVIHGCIRFAKFEVLSNRRIIRIPRTKGAQIIEREYVNLNDLSSNDVFDFINQDLIDHCILTKNESKFIELRLKSKTNAEIAEVLGIGVSTVADMKKRLYERLNKELCQK